MNFRHLKKVACLLLPIIPAYVGAYVLQMIVVLAMALLDLFAENSTSFMDFLESNRLVVMCTFFTSLYVLITIFSWTEYILEDQKRRIDIQQKLIYIASFLAIPFVCIPPTVLYFYLLLFIYVIPVALLCAITGMDGHIFFPDGSNEVARMTLIFLYIVQVAAYYSGMIQRLLRDV